MAHACGLAVSHSENSAAAARCALCLNTGGAEPPPPPAPRAPLVHWGRAAARQSPSVFLASGWKYDGAQAEFSGEDATPPLSRFWFGRGELLASLTVLMSCALMSC